jgi:hypothetical protein
MNTPFTVDPRQGPRLMADITRRAILTAAALALVAGAILSAHVITNVGTATAAPATQSDPDPDFGRTFLFVPWVARDADRAELPAPATAAAPTSTPTLLPLPTLAPPTATSGPTATPTRIKPNYDEPLTDFPPIDDLRDGYDANRWYETMLTLLERRYATGHHIVTELDDSRAKADIWTRSQRDSFDGLLRSLQLAVHEMDHQLGFQEGVLATRFERYAYVIRDDETRLVPNVDTFPRSEIAQYITGPLDNQYKQVYLTGSSGNQNFNTLLDEFNAYTHSLFTGYGIHDQLRGRTSYRDGLVTMMLYVEFFLRHARENHPDDYAALTAELEMRQLVDLLWRRADFILLVTEDISELRLDPDAVETKMREPEMLDEVARFVRGRD